MTVAIVDPDRGTLLDARCHDIDVAIRVDVSRDGSPDTCIGLIDAQLDDRRVGRWREHDEGRREGREMRVMNSGDLTECGSHRRDSKPGVVVQDHGQLTGGGGRSRPRRSGPAFGRHSYSPLLQAMASELGRRLSGESERGLNQSGELWNRLSIAIGNAQSEDLLK